MEDDAIPGRWRLAGIAIAVIAFFLVCAAIHVSTYDVRYSTRVWAQETMEAGTSAAVRIAVLGRQLGGTVKDSTATVSLVRAEEAVDAILEESKLVTDGAVHLGRLEASDTGLIEDSLNLPPDIAPGNYILLVGVSTSAGPDELAAFRVLVVPSGSTSAKDWLATRPACEESSIRKTDGGWHRARRCVRGAGPVHLYPEDGHLVAHVARPVHVWVPPWLEAQLDTEQVETDAIENPDSPAPREQSPAGGPEELESPNPAAPKEDASLDEPHGLPKLLEIVPLRPSSPGQDINEPAKEAHLAPLDSLGMASFTYEPTFPRGSLLMRTGEIESRVWLRDLPASLTITPSKRLLRPGKVLNIDLALRQPNRPVTIDVWMEGRWLSAHSGRIRGDEERIGVPLPEHIRGLVTIKASPGHDGTGPAYTSVWIDEDEGGLAVYNLARRLERLPNANPLAAYPPNLPRQDPLISWAAGLEESALESLSASEAERAAAAMLSRVEPIHPSPPLLGDTTGYKLLELEVRKERLRRPILFGLVLVSAATLVSAGWLIVSYQRRVRWRLLELDLDDDEDEATERRGPMTNGGGWLAPSLVLGAVLIAAVASLLVFLETLRWNRGDVFAARQRESASQTTTTKEPGGRREQDQKGPR